MQTKAGAKKLIATMTDKFGSYDSWAEWMRKNGAEGGRKGRTGGFASEKIGADGLTGKQRARIAGQRGGTISRKPNAKQTT